MSGTAPDTNASRVVNLGCRLNAAEADVVADHLRDAPGETVVVNTCAVTNAAVADSRRAVRRARRDNPGARIVVTGCAAQVDPQAFAGMAEVDQVVGNHEKMLAATFLDPGTERVRVNDIQSVRETAPFFVGSSNAEGRHQDRTRAFLQVQNGCDHRCTFCIIPYGRGRARSVPAGEVVNHVRNLVGQGYREVVLTGVDISSWGGDLPGTPSLGDLVRRVLKLVPELPRLRLSSIDPAEVDDALLEAMGDPRMSPYLHLSLQAGDDMVLKRMKRRHSRGDVVRLAERLRAVRPDIAFGADVIAGFPTETDAMHANTLELVESLPIAWAHVFPYSPREGTPAARMPAVDGSVVKARARALREAGARARAAHLAGRVGDVDVALFEADGMGRLPDFSRVEVSTPPDAGTLAEVRVSGHDGDRLFGEISG